MAKIQLESSGRMSNTAYHQTGKPTWWAYYKDGEETCWLKIPETRGDQRLNCETEIPDDFTGTIYIGVGKRGSKGAIREEIEVD